MEKVQPAVPLPCLGMTVTLLVAKCPEQSFQGIVREAVGIEADQELSAGEHSQTQRSGLSQRPSPCSEFQMLPEKESLATKAAAAKCQLFPSSAPHPGCVIASVCSSLQAEDRNRVLPLVSCSGVVPRRGREGKEIHFE